MSGTVAQMMSRQFHMHRDLLEWLRAGRKRQEREEERGRERKGE